MLNIFDRPKLVIWLTVIIGISCRSAIAEPEPPVVFCSGNECVGAVGQLYDPTLGGTRNIPIPYILPTLPQNIQRTIRVNPSTFGQALANNSSNTRFELEDGSYGEFPDESSVPYPTVISDVEIVSVNPGGANFSGYFSSHEMNRVWIEGINIDGKLQIEGFSEASPPSDVVFENIHVENNVAGQSALVPQAGLQRVVVQNSDIIQNAEAFGLIGGNEGDGNTNFHVFNSLLQYTHPGGTGVMVRFMGTTTSTIWADNWLEVTNAGRWRFHGSMNGVALLDNIGINGAGYYFFEETLGGSRPSASLQNVHIERNDTYDTVQSDFETVFSPFSGNIGNARAVDNNLYLQSYTGSQIPMPAGANAWSGGYSGNFKQTYQAPPARTQGANR